MLSKRHLFFFFAKKKKKKDIENPNKTESISEWQYAIRRSWCQKLGGVLFSSEDTWRDLLLNLLEVSWA